MNNSFVFTRKLYNSLLHLDKKIKADVYVALIDYTFTGTMDGIDPTIAAILVSFRESVNGVSVFSNKKKKKQPSNKHHLWKYVVMFNEICKDLPQVTKITDNRMKMLNARIKDYTDNEIKRCFTLVHASDFLSGRANNDRQWRADFDWVLKPSNFQKILEERYMNLGNNFSGNKIHNPIWRNK